MTTALDEFAQAVKPDKDGAQIVVEITEASKSFEELKKIIEKLGVSITEVKQLSPQCVVIKLNVKDMREIVLKLTESGICHVQGINALFF